METRAVRESSPMRIRVSLQRNCREERREVPSWIWPGCRRTNGGGVMQDTSVTLTIRYTTFSIFSSTRGTVPLYLSPHTLHPASEEVNANQGRNQRLRPHRSQYCAQRDRRQGHPVRSCERHYGCQDAGAPVEIRLGARKPFPDDHAHGKLDQRRWEEFQGIQDKGSGGDRLGRCRSRDRCGIDGPVRQGAGSEEASARAGEEGDY